MCVASGYVPSECVCGLSVCGQCVCLVKVCVCVWPKCVYVAYVHVCVCVRLGLSSVNEFILNGLKFQKSTWINLQN